MKTVGDLSPAKRETLLSKMKDNSALFLYGSTVPYFDEAGCYMKGFAKKTLDLDYFYLTGQQESNGILVLYKLNGVCHEKLFVEEKIVKDELWSGIIKSIDEVKDETHIDDVVLLDEYNAFLDEILGKKSVEKLYFNIKPAQKMNITDDMTLYLDILEKKYGKFEVESISDEIIRLRMVKTEEELAYMQEAVDNAGVAVHTMMERVKPGLYEYQLKATARFTFMDRGVTPTDPMVATGYNNVLLHYPESNAQIKDGDMVLIDICPRVNWYASDVSRTFPANGKFTSRQKEVYNAVLRVNDYMTTQAKPGITIKELNVKCADMIGEELIGLGLIDKKEEYKRYFYHGLGHYVGLGIHDVGTYDMKLQENMVMTIEPGIYIGEENFGVRIEDTVYITKDGGVNMSKNILRTVDEIEEFMSKG